jgi:predicted TIM-barrel fold metal-dependent hydrolase
MARDFLLADYRAETGAHDVLGIVHVSAVSAPRAYLAETRWIDDALDSAGIPAAVIGALEPTLSRAELEADLDAQAASPRFRGVRVLTGLDPDSQSAVDVCSLLDERGYTFDLVAHPAEVAGFGRLLERFPDLDVVLEHAGWPDGTSPEDFASWREGIATLAAHANVSCKISGLGMVTHTLEVDALRPWIEACLEVFGAERCMFGGNFPVDAMYGSFDTLIAACLAASQGLSQEQRRALFVENARRAYRL